MNINHIGKLMKPLKQRVKGLVTRGYVLDVNVDGQRVRIKAGMRYGELADLIELLEPYGFSAPPLPDKDGVLVFSVGGAANHRVAINAGGRYHRPTDLEPGESCLYTDEGDRVALRRGRHIEVIGGESVDVQTKVATVKASTSATIVSPQITLDGANVHCTGELAVDGGIGAGGNIQSDGVVRDHKGSMDAMRGVFDGHNHDGDSGGTTSNPNQKM